MKNNMKVNLLDCTLRDGSYAIDYQFTAEDTAILVSALEHAGFEYIEIGHGMGMNASSVKYGLSAATDEQYIKAASSAVKDSKFGMFFIPDIGTSKMIDIAVNYGMKFIRIGTNVNEVEKSESYIKKAKDLGLFTFSNLMKSYSLPVDDFLKKAELSVKYGADVVVVVDSAGCMMPEEVESYVSILKKELGISVGFHAHNNLMLAVANSIYAAKAGAEFVDSSLQGMGRSAGNAQTETLIICLERLNFKTDINLYKTMNLGEKILRPIMGDNKGIDAISAIMGYAKFHSSYYDIIRKVSGEYNIDPKELILKVGETQEVQITESLVRNMAHKIINNSQRYNQQFNLNIYLKEELNNSTTLATKSATIAKEIYSISKKTSKKSIFTIAETYNKNKERATFPFIRQNANYIVGNSEVVNSIEAEEIFKAVDGNIDYLLIDLSLKDIFKKCLKERIESKKIKTNVLMYDDLVAKIKSIKGFVLQLYPDFESVKINIIGHDKLAEIVREEFSRNFEKIYYNADKNDTYEVLIGVTPFENIIDNKYLKMIKPEGIIIDAGPGSLYPEVIEEANNQNIDIFRIDMRAGLFSEIINVIETNDLITSVKGRVKIDGIAVIAGGIIGNKGDIIVDSITNPSRVIGVADGRGCMLNDNELLHYLDDIKNVKNEIAKNKFC